MSAIETKIVCATILPHPNGDNLEICRIGGEGGFESAVGKNQFKDGDLVIYIMPGSVITKDMNATLMTRSKIQIKDGRIRAINIRGVLSEGLCLDPKIWLDYEVKENDDVTKELGIIKYEPPHPSMQNALKNGKGINFNYKNENFKEYYCVEKFKKYPKVLEELNRDVVVTVKMHGSNFRCGIVKKPNYKKSLWKKFIGLFVKENSQEFLVGSHNKIKAPTQSALKYKDYYNTDTWWRIAKKYNLENIVKQISENIYEDDQQSTNLTCDLPDVVIYGEIIGPKVQKGYCYNVLAGELELRIFDIMINGKYVNWDKLKNLCKQFNLPMVEEVYRGSWNLNIIKLAKAIDKYGDKKFVREGIVIRPLIESWHPKCGRVIFKYLNPIYLLDKTNSEYH